MHPKNLSAISQIDGETHLLPSIDGDWIVPETFSIFKADFVRNGSDLVIQDPSGTSFRLDGYFNGQPLSDILSHDGAALRGGVVEKLAGPLFPAQYAQASGFNLSDAIGQVEVLTGAAFVQRTDGQTVELEIGTKVFQGDVVRTDDGSTLGLTFADGTIFTLASGSRMVLDELIYDPQATDNSGVFNLVEGSFVFIAGQTAKTGGIEISTPAATMGIRGTTGKIDIQTINGVSTVTVSLNPDPDSGLGAIELYDLEGNLITTITSTDTKWVITPPFADQPPIEIDREAADINDDNILLSQAIAAFQSAITRVQNGQTFVEFSEGDGDAQTGTQEPEAEDEGQDNAPPPQPAPLNETEDDGTNGESGRGNPELDGVDDPIEQPETGTGDDDDASLTPNNGTEFADAGTATTEFLDVSFQSTEDTPLTSQLPVISPSGQSVQVSLSRGAENGLVVLASDGTFTYTPNPNFEGTDTFVVSGLDESGTLQEAEITVVVDPVNDAPTANLRTVSATSVEEGAETAPGAGSVGGTLTYVDVDEGDAQGTWTIAPSDSNQSAFGTITIEAVTGTWRYDLDQDAADALGEGEVFEETFLATITDAEGATDVSTLTITVTGSNDSPVISADTQQIRAFMATGPRAEEAAGATDIASGTLSYVDVDEGDIAATWSIRADVGNETAFGEMTIDPDTGRWTYKLTPDTLVPLIDGETAVETFVATVTDAEGASTDQPITITITGTNAAPTIVFSIEDVSATVVEDGFGTNTSTIGAPRLALVESSGRARRLVEEEGQASSARQDLIGGTANATGTLRYVDSDGIPGEATWSIEPQAASLGVMTIDAVTGQWRYFLDQEAADSLRQGDEVIETFLATVTDPFGGTATQVITITVQGSNDEARIATAPQELVGTVEEGVIATASGKLSFVDPDAAPGEVSRWSISPDGPSRGAMEIDAETGQWTFTLDPELGETLPEGEPVIETFTASVTDSFGAVATQTITLTLIGENDAPTFVTGMASLSRIEPGVTVDLSAFGNDVDDGEDGSSLTYSIAGEPSEGAASIDGLFLTFSTQGDFNDLSEGQSRDVEIGILVTDAFGASVEGTVTVTVTGQNTAPIITSAITDARGEVIEPGANTGGVPEIGGTLTYADDDASSPTSGQWTVAPTASALGSIRINETSGVWLYVLNQSAADQLNAGDSVTERFTATITDETGLTDSQEITVIIGGTNDAPTLTATTETLSNRDEAIRIDLTALGGDPDGEDDGTSLIYTLVNGQGDGSDDDVPEVGGNFAIEGSELVFRPEGEFNFLSEGQSQDVTAIVRATDSRGASVTEEITVTIAGTFSNPVITSSPLDARGAVKEAGANSAGISEISGTLTYTDDDAETPTSGTWTIAPFVPALGTITIDPTSGTWTFTLDNNAADTLNANESVDEVFTATVTDATGRTDSTQITVTIEGTNDAPTLASKTESISNRDDAVRIDLSLLADDVDAEDDGGTLTYTLVSAESDASDDDEIAETSGHFVIEGNELVFRPEGDFNFLSEGQSQDVTALVRATDARGASVTEEITVTVTGTFSDPVITSGPLAALGDVNEAGDGGPGVPEISGTLTYTDDDAATPTSGTWSIAPFVPELGTIAIDPVSGKWTYTLNNTAADALDAGDSVDEVFTATITDTTGRSDSTQITVTITGANDAPTLDAKTESIDKGLESISFDLAALAADVDADDTAETLRFEIVSGPSAGNAYIEGSELFFTTGNDFADLGPDQSRQVSIEVSVFDEAGAFDTNTIKVTVNGSNTAPNILTGSVSTGTAREAGVGVIPPETGSDASGTLLYSDADERAGFPATWTVVANSADPLGQMQINAQTGKWEYFLDQARADSLRDGATVQESFTATVTDEFGGIDTTQIAITITGTNDKPVIDVEGSTLSAMASDESSTSLSGQLLFDDPDSFVTSASWTIAFVGEGGPEFGTMSINASGVWTYQAFAGAIADLSPEDDLTERFVATVTDEFGASDSIFVDINIMGGSTAPVITSSTSDATGIIIENDETSAKALFASGTLAYSDADEGEVPGEWSITTEPFDVSFEGNAFLDPGDTSLGSIKINAESGKWEYTLFNDVSEFLNEGDNITEKYLATITDADGETANQVVTVTIKGTNDAPFVTTLLKLNYDPADTPLSIDVFPEVQDYDDTTFNLLEVFTGGSGTVSIDTMGTADPTDDRLLYTPNPEFVGKEYVAYTVADSGGKETNGEVEITVANAPPTVTDSSVTIDPGGNQLDPSLTWTPWQNETTGETHYYAFVLEAGDLVWSAAAAAAAQTGGYLATVTSQGEQDLLAGLKGGSYAWLGGSDAAVEGEWRWETGPEAGSQFWQGDETGTAIPGAYENWNSIEPNNLGGEDYLSMLPSGLWNDIPADVRPFYPIGYLVEHEGLADSSGSVAGNAEDPNGQPLTFAVVGSYVGFEMDSEGSWTLDSSEAVFDQFTDGTLDITYSVTDSLGASTQATLELVLADWLTPSPASASGSSRIALSAESASAKVAAPESIGDATSELTATDAGLNVLFVDSDPSARSGASGPAVAIDLDDVFAATPELFAEANVIDISNGQRNVMSVDADDLLRLIEGNAPDADEAIEINMDAFDSVTLEPSDDWTIAATGEKTVQLTGTGGEFAALGAFATLSFAVDDTQPATS